jgi:hypothetical protein
MVVHLRAHIVTTEQDYTQVHKRGHMQQTYY